MTTRDSLQSSEARHLNTPRLVADANQNTVWKWDQQEPFGADTPNGDPGNTGTTFDLPLRLPGQRYDTETGSHYNYFRDYDPSIGRYAESDPIEAGLNTYAYVGGYPLLAADPLGLKLVKLMELEKSWVNLVPMQYMFGGDKGVNPGNTPRNNSHQIYLSTQWGEVDDDCDFYQMTESRFSGRPKWYAFWVTQWLEVNLRLYHYKKSCGKECAYKHVRFDTKEEHWAGADPSMDNLRAVGGALIWH